MDNLEKMDKFLESYNLPRLNQEKRENMNRPVRNNEIESVIKKSSNKQKFRTRGITGEFYQTFGKKTPSLLQVFWKKKKMQKQEHSKAHSMRWSSPWYQNQTKTTQNYRPISLMNTDAKILNKILANRIQQHIKKLIHNDQLGLFQECRDSSIYANQSMGYTQLDHGVWDFWCVAEFCLLKFCGGFLHICSSVILACSFLFLWDLCQVLVSGWWWPHRMSLEVYHPLQFSGRVWAG